MSDLRLAMRYGWRYEWVRDLPVATHAILIEEVLEQQEG